MSSLCAVFQNVSARNGTQVSSRIAVPVQVVVQLTGCLGHMALVVYLGTSRLDHLGAAILGLYCTLSNLCNEFLVDLLVLPLDSSRT